MTPITETLGFIGIGLMGEPMVLRLLAAGFKVNVWNRRPEKLSVVTKAGATAYSHLPDLLRSAEIILLCLADGSVVKAIIDQHLIHSTITHKLIIDLSSIDPQTTRELAQKLTPLNIQWVDAPVSGGVKGAEQGTLAIMAGGTEHTINIARAVLAPLYQNFTPMGDVGSGQITKICNQMIVSCNVMVIAEMMALAEHAGVNAAMIPQALAGGFADSKPLQIVAPAMAADCFDPVKWRVKTLLKDLNMAVDLAKIQGNDVPMSQLAQQLMRLHAQNGYAEQDPTTLIKHFRRP